MTDSQLIGWVIASVAVLLALVVAWVWRKGRAFVPGDVFRASRWSRGNLIFPTQVLIGPSSVVQYSPRWIGKQEESIHTAHISSVKIDTGLLFSHVLIETSGGASPIRCQGHTKRDAVRMKALIERYQNEYIARRAPQARQAPKSEGKSPKAFAPIT